MKQTAIRHLWPLLALALLIWGAPVAAQTGAAMLRVEPESLSLAAGETQTVAIVIQDAADVYGIDVRAAFDPALIEVVDADPTRDGVQMTPGALPQPDFVALNLADNAAGALRYAVTQVNPTPPAAGGGVVFTFQVRGRANGVSPLRLTLVEMANRSGELLPVTTRDGAISVTGGRPPAPTGVALTAPAEGAPPAGVGAATAAPTVAAEATTAPAATIAAATTTAATASAATASTATTAPPPATADSIIARATTGPAAPPEATLTAATVAPGATAAPPDATAATPVAATTGQTAATTAATTAAGAGDTAAGSAAPPAVVGAGTDPTSPNAATPPDTSPGGALLIGGVIVLLLVAAGTVLAWRGRR